MTNSNISIIVAASENNCIGLDGKMPWHLPTDLKRFKELTLDHVVIMGRHTFESIGHPLAERVNIVATKKAYFPKDSHVLIDSDIWKGIYLWSGDVFIIGGGKIYKEAFKYANKLYLTRIHAHIDGDTYLEGFKEDEWNLISTEGPFEENGFKFSFLTYEKKKLEIVKKK